MSDQQATTTAPPESKPMEEPPNEPDPDELPTRRIHIKGMGSIGHLIAHSLRVLPNPPPITLCMHKEEQYQRFKKDGSAIRLIDKKNGINDEQTGYDVDLETKSSDPDPYEGNTRTWVYEAWGGKSRDGPANPLTAAEKMESGEVYIHCLILTVKALHTVGALETIKHRLDAKSTVCLMQNGLGQIDEVIEKVFPNVATRPTFLIGIVSHGCYMEGGNNVVHAGFGAISLGIYRDTELYPLPPKHLQNTPKSDLSPSDRQKYYPTDEELYTKSLSARYLLRTLTRSPVLACAAYPYLDLLQLQLEKLTMNAILNPLTSIFDIHNGVTLQFRPLNTIENLLVSELSLVIRSLPELQGIPGINQRFSADRLKNLFIGVAEKTAANSSSMREDIRLKRPGTEIDYINGYIVKRGEEVGIKAALNFMIVQMIKAKSQIANQAQEDAIPWGTSKVEGTSDRGKEGEQEDLVKDDWEKVGGAVGVVTLDDVGAKRKDEL